MSGIAVSIPFWVSTVLRPNVTDWDGIRSALFQSRSGFLLSCDTRRRSHGAGGAEVSIPFWVSTVLRLDSQTETLFLDPEFQSRSGFLLSCDPRGACVMAMSAEFQSRSGFLLSCDLRGRRRLATDLVSIPFWVSTVLRLAVVGAGGVGHRGFNPVLGFYCPATLGLYNGIEVAD